MVCSPPPKNPIIHDRTPTYADKTLCGRSVGRVYTQHGGLGAAVTCPKCIKLACKCVWIHITHSTEEYPVPYYRCSRCGAVREAS